MLALKGLTQGEFSTKPEISTGHLHQSKSPDFGRGFLVSGGTWLMKASPSCAHPFAPHRAIECSAKAA